MVPSILSALGVQSKPWGFTIGTTESRAAGEAWLVDADPDGELVRTMTAEFERKAAEASEPKAATKRRRAPSGSSAKRGRSGPAAYDEVPMDVAALPALAAAGAIALDDAGEDL